MIDKIQLKGRLFLKEMEKGRKGEGRNIPLFLLPDLQMLLSICDG